MEVCHSLILLPNSTVGFRRHSSEQCALRINVNYLLQSLFDAYSSNS
jgi:hypothetical protein